MRVVGVVGVGFGIQRGTGWGVAEVRYILEKILVFIRAALPF